MDVLHISAVPNIVWIILASVTAGGVLNNFLSIRYFGPVLKLKKAMQQVAEGDFSVRLETEKQMKEIRDIYSNFNLMVQELEATEILQTDFVSNVSHEFKTPLTLILSSVESLDSELKNKGISVNKEINLMYNNSRRLLRLINQLLDYRKAEDKKFVLKASKTNILDFSKSIIVDFERESKKRNIDFTLGTNNPGLEVYIDRNLMDKVYFNLLSNAFKFTPEKWFPSWARYTVLVPSGIETIWWQKTLNSKVIEIVTPDFKLLWKNTPISIKDKLEFIFNDEVNLNDFISNFSLSTYSNSNLKFENIYDANGYAYLSTTDNANFKSLIQEYIKNR